MAVIRLLVVLQGWSLSEVPLYIITMNRNFLCKLLSLLPVCTKAEQAEFDWFNRPTQCTNEASIQCVYKMHVHVVPSFWSRTHCICNIFLLGQAAKSFFVVSAIATAGVVVGTWYVF